jgi:hypothetical protein
MSHSQPCALRELGVHQQNAMACAQIHRETWLASKNIRSFFLLLLTFVNCISCFISLSEEMREGSFALSNNLIVIKKYYYEKF